MTREELHDLPPLDWLKHAMLVRGCEVRAAVFIANGQPAIELREPGSSCKATTLLEVVKMFRERFGP